MPYCCFILVEACLCRLELAYFAEKNLKIDWSVKMPLHWLIREFKQIATAGATTAAVTEKVWGEYVAAVCLILAK